MISNTKYSENILAYLTTKATKVQEGRETTKMEDRTKKGQYKKREESVEEKNRGIYEKKLIMGMRGRQMENKRVEEKIS